MADRYNRGAIKERLVARMFNARLVENRWRGDLVEEIVHAALAPDGWVLCSGDWASWDLTHPSDIKIQVKQTARLQTWGVSPPTNRYSIKPVTGFYRGSEWKRLAEPARLAEIYIFAHHPVEDGTRADHWDAGQWQFYVVGETHLAPGKQSISIIDVRRLAEPVGIDALADAVQRVAAATSPNGRTGHATPGPSGSGELDFAPGGSL